MLRGDDFNTSCLYLRGVGSWIFERWEPSVLMVLDAAQAEIDLRAGRLDCLRCDGTLRPWGWARPRSIREAGGRCWSLRPRRSSCGSCGATSVLLPASCLPRRRDSAKSAITVLTRAAAGLGAGRIGVELGIPPATVRGLLRHLRDHSDELRDTVTVLAHDIDRMLEPIAPQATRLADLAEIIGVAVAAVIRRGLLPAPPDPAAVAAIITCGYQLPARAR